MKQTIKQVLKFIAQLLMVALAFLMLYACLILGWAQGCKM